MEQLPGLLAALAFMAAGRLARYIVVAIVA